MSDKREQNRTALLTTANIWRDGEILDRARIRNLSAKGMGGTCDAALRPGDRICLELNGIGRVYGQVRWVNGRAFGLEFDEAIDPALLSLPKQPSPPEMSPHVTHWRPPETSWRRPGLSLFPDGCTRATG